MVQLLPPPPTRLIATKGLGQRWLDEIVAASQCCLEINLPLSPIIFSATVANLDFLVDIIRRAEDYLGRRWGNGDMSESAPEFMLKMISNPSRPTGKHSTHIKVFGLEITACFTNADENC
jgi:hypothetical protein